MRCQWPNIGIKDGNIKGANIVVGRRNDESSIDGEEPLMSNISPIVLYFTTSLLLSPYL